MKDLLTSVCFRQTEQIFFLSGN